MLAISSVDGIFLECKYNFDRWPTSMGTFYACDVKNLDVKIDDFTVKNVSSNHRRRYSNKNVISVDIHNQNCPIVPVGIAEFFPSIEAITIGESRLERITNKDLRPFKSLFALLITRNKLQSLAGDLFIYSPRIDYIDFSGNQIKTIGLDILKPLRKVRGIFLNKNVCIDMDYSDYSAENLAVVRQAMIRQCADASSISRNIVN